MFHLRRATLRALSAAPSTTVTATASRISSRTQQYALLTSRVQRPAIASRFTQSRFYATEPHSSQRTQKEEEESSLSTSAEATEAQLPSRESAAAEQQHNLEAEQPSLDKTSSTLESAADSVRTSASQAAGAVQSAVGSAAEAASSAAFGSRFPGGGDSASPSETLYVGNLYFEVSEQTLQREFEKFGAVESVKIIYDGRGLSKGFGYVKFSSVEDATAARNAVNGQVLEGRRMAINYALKTEKARRAPLQRGERRNPPSRTLFIGNMSYEMTDKDLNDLFREIKNVTDVRVAIDRRTGQPRGFAHADFLDVESATSAADFLETKEFYGRPLRVDYTFSRAMSPA